MIQVSQIMVFEFYVKHFSSNANAVLKHKIYNYFDQKYFDLACLIHAPVFLDIKKCSVKTKFIVQF